VTRYRYAVIDPGFHIVPSEAYMTADPESRGSVPTVPPRIHSRDGHVEILRQVFNGKQSIKVLHRRIIRREGFK
jgi:hypothetical protein